MSSVSTRTGDARRPEASATVEILAPDDPGYEEGRRVFNGLIDRRPALIVRCRSASDVAEGLAIARDGGFEVSIRGGGHSIAGRAVVDDGVMIDLSPMTAIDVDPEARTIRVGGGVTWGALDEAAAAHGLATTGGTISSTGVAGLTLGGGFGWLMGARGLVVDNLVSVELVTADGEIIEVDAERHPDLFWAIRGGGGNFGVVTAFVFRLHPVETVVGGLVVHPFDVAGDLLRHARTVAAAAPDELAVMPVLVHAPDGSGTPVAAFAVCHGGSIEDATRDLRPLLEFGAPLLVDVKPIPYPSINTMLDDGLPEGSLNYWKSGFVDALDDKLIDALVDAFPSCPSPMSGIAIEHFHGAATRVAVDATAVPHRVPSFNVLIFGVWTDRTTTEANTGWVRETYARLEPFLVGRRYQNYFSADDDTAAVRAAYGPNYERLRAVKRRYDPGNVFHLNVNIEPADPD